MLKQNTFQKNQHLPIILIFIILAIILIITYFFTNSSSRKSSQEAISSNSLSIEEENSDLTSNSVGSQNWQQTVAVSGQQLDPVINFITAQKSLAQNAKPEYWKTLLTDAKNNQTLENTNNYNWETISSTQLLDFISDDFSQYNQSVDLQLEAYVEISNTNNEKEMLYVFWRYNLICPTGQNECKIVSSQITCSLLAVE